ncbi:MAG: LPS export ABC transporter periplasmic protein LptC [Bacteroidetes bacterium]|nr:LPS export ABC transporter periplasmic protein LptC [Bacteroidota bacterium]
MRAFLRSAAAIFSGTFFLLFCSCENDPATVHNYTQNLSLPTQTAHNVDLFYSDSAKMKVHLTAGQVDEFQGGKPHTEMSKGVRVDFFDDSGKVSTYLTSENATRIERDNMMEANKNVVVVNSKGDKLTTDKLTWDGKSRKIYTKSFVTITTADQVTWGDGMEADEMFNHYVITNPTGEYLLRDDTTHAGPK